MKYFVALLLGIMLFFFVQDIRGKTHFFQSWQNSFDLCDSYCNSSGQGYVKSLQISMGTCICDNEEGHRVAEGYHLYINNKCDSGEDRD